MAHLRRPSWWQRVALRVGAPIMAWALRQRAASIRRRTTRG